MLQKHCVPVAVFRVGIVTGLLFAAGSSVLAGPIEEKSARLRLLSAYAAQIEKIENNEIVFKSGKRMPYDDGKGEKSFDDWLKFPDVEDMFSIQYAPGELSATPSKNYDPGRARNEEFFRNIYGDCRSGEVASNMTSVTWLPKKSGEAVKFSRVNGAAARLSAVSKELDALPASFNIYLYPSAGTYNCRVVAGTNSYSAHSYGIAIDIALKHAHYWRWVSAGKDGVLAYKNEIPFEIVRVFEKHGFIWGGKWYHYDTMHFEYRPELMPPGVPLDEDQALGTASGSRDGKGGDAAAPSEAGSKAATTAP